MIYNKNLTLDACLCWLMYLFCANITQYLRLIMDIFETQKRKSYVFFIEFNWLWFSIFQYAMYISQRWLTKENNHHCSFKLACQVKFNAKFWYIFLLFPIHPSLWRRYHIAIKNIGNMTLYVLYYQYKISLYSSISIRI